MFFTAVAHPGKGYNMAVAGVQSILPRAYMHTFRALRGLTLKYFGLVSKTNRRGRVQQRVLVVTQSHLYSCLPEDGDIQRCIDLSHITEILVHAPKCEIALVVPSEYDLLFQALGEEALNDILSAVGTSCPRITQVDSTLVKFGILRIEKPPGFSRVNPGSCVMESQAHTSHGVSSSPTKATGANGAKQLVTPTAREPNGDHEMSVVAAHEPIAADPLVTDEAAFGWQSVSKVVPPTSPTIDKIDSVVIPETPTDQRLSKNDMDLSVVWQSVNGESDRGGVVESRGLPAQRLRDLLLDVIRSDREVIGELRATVDGLRSEVDRLMKDNLRLRQMRRDSDL